MSRTDSARPASETSPNLLPFTIFAAALLLRLWNIGWALPGPGRLFSFHPDESMVVSASLSVNPFRFQLDPHFYPYGALPLLLNSAVIHFGEMIGLIGPGPAPSIPSGGALLASRFVTAICGALTCLFLYGAGRLIYGRGAGLIAAALYAVAPLAVQHGHFATVDVDATFFIAGSLYFASRATSVTEARPSDLIWAGVWAGLAAAAKYNAGLVLLAGVAAWWLTRRERKLLSLLISSLVAFLVACPTILLNPGGVLEGIRKESQHVSSGHGEVFVGTGSGFLYHIAYNLAWGLTWPLLAVVLAGVAGAVVRRSRGDGVLAAFALPYYILIGLAAVKFTRYDLPLLPPLFLWVGALVASLHRWRRPVGIAAGIVTALAGMWALLFAVGLVGVMAGPDPRDEAAAYIRSQPNVHSVGFAAGPWFYSPTLAPFLAEPIPQFARQSAEGTTNPVLFAQPQEWEIDSLTRNHPDAIAINEFEYADAERARQSDALAYLAAVEAQYPVRHVFAHPVEVFGIRFTKLNTKRGLPTQNLPHDMRYTNPTEVVFTK